MKRALLGLVVGFMGVMGATASAWAQAPREIADPAKDLDGKRYSVQMGQKDETDPELATLVFDDGRFYTLDDRTKGLNRTKGFDKTAYELWGPSDAKQFRAMSMSDEKGEMLWQGTVRGSHIEGTATWMRTGKDAEIYYFSGEQLVE